MTLHYCIGINNFPVKTKFMISYLQNKGPFPAITDLSFSPGPGIRRFSIGRAVFVRTLSLTLCCAGAGRISPTVAGRLTGTLPGGFPEDLNRLGALITGKLSSEPLRGGLSAELVFYDYSSGKEVYSISEKAPVSVAKNSFNSRIGILVKIKKNGTLARTEFLEISAKSKNEAVDIAVAEIVKILRSSR